MKLTTRWAAACAAAFAAMCAAAPAAAQVFNDDFNSIASAANYVVVSNDAPSAFATFAYDYSDLGIPSAPNSGDSSTLGVKLDANKLVQPQSTTGQTEAVTLHTVLAYTGDYAVKFDAFINVIGPFPAGGNGSTNYLTAGVGGDALTRNQPASSGNSAAAAGVGGWIAVNGENGNGNDYRLYKGTTVQATSTGQYAAPETPEAGDQIRNGEANPYYHNWGGVNVDAFPVQGAGQTGGFASQTGTSYLGGFGMEWHEVELRVDADGGTGGAASMKWIIDGVIIGTLDAGANGSFTSTGSVTLGYSDPTANLAANPELSFAVIDNLRVIVPEPASMSLLAVAGAMLVTMRRRK